MSKSTFIRLAVVLVVAFGLGLWWATVRRPARENPPESERTKSPGSTTTARPGGASDRAKAILANRGLSAAEKAAKVEQIKRDYDEVRSKASAEFAAAGASFPGGLNAFLRQLALLEREKHEDFATVLDARELEDLEMADTTSGQTVSRVLGDTAATDEQKRAAFRLQREFENRFALTFDLTPPALLTRERERVVTQEKVRAVLGNDLFGSWLRSEGPEFTQMKDFTARQGLPADAALNLWRARNDLTLKRLEIAGQTNLTPDQLRNAQEILTREAETRVLAILGPGALESARQEAMGWLPRK